MLILELGVIVRVRARDALGYETPVHEKVRVRNVCIISSSKRSQSPSGNMFNCCAWDPRVVSHRGQFV